MGYLHLTIYRFEWSFVIPKYACKLLSKWQNYFLTYYSPMDKRLLKVGLSYLYPSTLELKVWSLRGGSFSISWSAIDWRISSLKCLWQRHKNWNELEMNLPSPPCNYSCGKFSALHRRAIYIQKKSGYEASGDIALTKIQTLIFMKLYAVYTLKIYATIKDSSFEY